MELSCSLEKTRMAATLMQRGTGMLRFSCFSMKTTGFSYLLEFGFSDPYPFLNENGNPDFEFFYSRLEIGGRIREYPSLSRHPNGS